MIGEVENQCKILMDRIKQIQDSLDDEHEIALKLTSFDESIAMDVDNISYDGGLMIFNGTVNGHSATLFQHSTQLNFLVLVVPKENPSSPPRRIGFGVED